MRRLGLVAALCCASLLAGCSGSFSGINQTANTQPGSTSPGARLTGTVHGGQNPIAGSHVYLLAAASGASGAGQAAYGGAGIAASANNASQSLLSAASTGHSDSLGAYVLTGSDGSFAISGDYTCTAGQQVYLYALGGDPGLGTGVNPAAGLMAVLGNCPGTAGSTGNTFSSGTFVMMNEVSTVAAAYAMAGFATDATHVGSSGTALALTGIANAFANAANLETLGTGVALATTPAGNGTVPQAEINTLANILAACVNSNGAGSACTTLFANATADGTTTGAQPTETATAAINIAHHPAAALANLYGLAAGTPPFAPGLTSKPNDFAVAVVFPTVFGGYIAIDGSGNAWIPLTNTNAVLELSSLGVALSGTNGYSGGGLYRPMAIAIDTSGDAWIANSGNSINSVTELSNSGLALSGSGGFTGGGLVGAPVAAAIDGSGNVWITNSSSGVVELSNTGSVLSGAGGYTNGGINNPYGIAIDGSGNAWVTNMDTNSVIELSSSGSAMSGTKGYAGGGLNWPYAVTLDGSGNAWIADENPNTGSVGGVTELSNSGAFLSGAKGYSGGSLYGPYAIAVDGGGNAWVANSENDNIVEVSGTGTILSGATGYTSGHLELPSAIAIDGSGDVWTMNPQPVNRNACEFIGAATPVIPPIAAGLPATPTPDGSSNLGTRP